MKKNKVIKKHILSFRFIARAFVLNIPTLLVLSFLLIKGEISFLTAVFVLILAFVTVSFITAIVFNELESFTHYLKRQALGFEPEAPQFKKGLFSPFRLLDSFLAVKNMWSEQTLSDASILESLPDPVLMIDARAKIVYANKIMRLFFGDTILGKNIHDVFTDKVAQKSIDGVINGQSKTVWFDYISREVMPAAFQVKVELLPAKAKNGATTVMVLHDITQMTLFKQQQADFFANASHELKTPLSIISGFIETLQGPARDDEAARDKFLKMMEEQTNKMKGLVQNVLLLARFQNANDSPKSDVILISDLLTGVIESLKLKAQTHHKKLKLNLPYDLPRMMGNRSELYQVFQNLIDNAIKYGRENSTVTITAELVNAQKAPGAERYTGALHQILSVGIHNTGNPIAPQNIHRLFERFYRGDSLKHRLTEGTGLGLGIVQHLVQGHSGWIDVTSSPKKGTLFTVYLPLEL
ncbi:MAG: PAS domain-containing protein [Lactobacillales bacterium]|jgi:two-component system phosphate regulon sensor histidine kinase PhoR|nr:PAS domain-containing protein [Lactobacillales bacterium]